MKQIVTMFALLVSSVSAMAFSGSASCYYELYTKEHFTAPVLTEKFKVDLSKTEDISTTNAAIKRTLRLRTKPGTIDGKSFTHISFSQTYDGAHSGAVVPAANGTYVTIISKDESDLLAAYLFCDVRVNLMSARATAAVRPTYYEKIHCVNLREGGSVAEIEYTFDGRRRYSGQLMRRDLSGGLSTELIGVAELYLIQQNVVTIAGVGAVVEFQMPDESGGATPARVRINNPRYESESWLCKTSDKQE